MQKSRAAESTLRARVLSLEIDVLLRHFDLTADDVAAEMLLPSDPIGGYRPLIHLWLRAGALPDPDDLPRLVHGIRRARVASQRQPTLEPEAELAAARTPAALLMAAHNVAEYLEFLCSPAQRSSRRPQVLRTVEVLSREVVTWTMGLCIERALDRNTRRSDGEGEHRGVLTDDERENLAFALEHALAVVGTDSGPSGPDLMFFLQNALFLMPQVMPAGDDRPGGRRRRQAIKQRAAKAYDQTVVQRRQVLGEPADRARLVAWTRWWCRYQDSGLIAPTVRTDIPKRFHAHLALLDRGAPDEVEFEGGRTPDPSARADTARRMELNLRWLDIISGSDGIDRRQTYRAAVRYLAREAMQDWLLAGMTFRSLFWALHLREELYWDATVCELVRNAVNKPDREWHGVPESGSRPEWRGIDPQLRAVRDSTDCYMRAIESRMDAVAAS